MVYWGTLNKESVIIAVWKSIQSLFVEVFRDLPEGVKLFTEFVWKIRWFLIVGWVGWLVYQVVTIILPYLMWMFILKSTLGSLGSIISLFL